MRQIYFEIKYSIRKKKKQFKRINKKLLKISPVCSEYHLCSMCNLEKKFVAIKSSSVKILTMKVTISTKSNNPIILFPSRTGAQ